MPRKQKNAKHPIIQQADSLSAKEHAVNAEHISPNAIKVIEKLEQAGFEAYLVGGAIRDLLLGFKPKDFDVATNATPEQCKKLFRNARIIGRRFQIVHVRFGREVIEVTTFRADHKAQIVSGKSNKKSAASAEGMLLRDNVFGNIQEDALRRDFSCNALYYDVSHDRVYDFCQGLQCIENKSLKLIGEPVNRYKEDPVRMLRAVRFKAKLGFSIEAQTEAGIFDCADLLSNINTARLFDESLKLFLSGYSQEVFFDLEKYQLLPFLLCDSKRLLDSEFNKKLFTLALANTDKRIQQEKSINPAFLWAVFLWPLVIELKQELEHDQLPPMAALYEAANSVLSKQQRLVAISKRFQAVIKEIWELQLRLENTQGKRSERAYEHPRFRAGYDFLLLREQAGENCNKLGEFWTEMQKKQPRKEPQRKPYERPRKRRPQHKK